MTDTNRSKTVAIDKTYYWRPIDSNTPKGVKMQLINQSYGVAVYSTLGNNNAFFTHWAPLPTFEK